VKSKAETAKSRAKTVMAEQSTLRKMGAGRDDDCGGEEDDDDGCGGSDQGGGAEVGGVA
jgi:hypothetical protein